MELTPSLLDDYSGHEILLQFRAKHHPHCYPLWDRMRDCLVGRERDEDKCAAAARAFKPCAAEQKRARALASKARLDERRKQLGTVSREQHAAAEVSGESSKT